MLRSAVRVLRTSRALRSARALQFAACLLAVTACSASVTTVPPTSATASGAARTPAITLTGTAAPLPDFTSSAFPARATGWLLGTVDPGTSSARAQVWRTGDAGATWQVQWAGSGRAVSIGATDRRHAWALIGCAGPATGRACHSEVIATRNDGRSWGRLTALPSTVTQVQFASATSGVATSADACQSPDVRPCPGHVLVSRDGGARWARVLTGTGPLFATADAAGQIWAAGVVTSDGAAGSGDASVRFLTSTDEGRSWRPLGQLAGLGVLSASTDIQLAAGPAGLDWASVLDPQSCAMHGCDVAQLYQSGDGGTSWARAGLGSPGASGCGDSNVAFSAARGAVAWAAFSRNGGACAPPLGLVYRHGTSGWQRLPPMQLAEISWLSAVSQTVAYAISGQNAVVRTDDGGHRWTQLLPVPAPTGQVDALDASTALAAEDASDAGAILRTTDGGHSWRQIADLPGVITQLAFPDAGHGFALTFRLGPRSRPRWQLWRSGDEGLTWSQAGRLPEHARSWNDAVYGMWMAADGRGLLLTAAGVTPWAPGGGGIGPVRVWTTSDGGTRWARGHLLPVGRQGVGAVTFVPAGTGRWAGWLSYPAAQGSMRLEATADLGLTLTPVPGSPAVSGAQLVGQSAGFAWSLTTPPQGPAMATVLSLYQTGNGGRRWRHVALVISRSGAGPGLLDFTDASHGWLVSASATWHTSDGGRSWHRA